LQCRRADVRTETVAEIDQRKPAAKILVRSRMAAVVDEREAAADVGLAGRNGAPEPAHLIAGLPKEACDNGGNGEQPWYQGDRVADHACSGVARLIVFVRRKHKAANQRRMQDAPIDNGAASRLLPLPAPRGRVRLRTLSNLRWLAVGGQSAALFIVY